MSCRYRRGLTLIELMLSLSIAGLLVAGMTAALTLSIDAAEMATIDSAGPDQAGRALELVLADLQQSTRLDVSGSSVSMITPDRSVPADGLSETQLYLWSGTSGDPLTRVTSSGSTVTVAEDVRDFSVQIDSRTIPAIEVTDTANPLSWGYFFTVR
ncbi:MAG: prepilin-type N-terminal cleavage/methylation domain-containing protein [Phycisphaeraceae bacterium]